MTPEQKKSNLRMALILASIAASDGTRKGVRDAAFSGKITIPADQSVIGKAFSIDSTSGDVTVRDMSIQLMKGNVENPSDFDGIGYIEFDEDGIEAKTVDLLKELIGFGLVTVSPVA